MVVLGVLISVGNKRREYFPLVEYNTDFALNGLKFGMIISLNLTNVNEPITDNFNFRTKLAKCNCYK